MWRWLIAAVFAAAFMSACSPSAAPAEQSEPAAAVEAPSSAEAGQTSTPAPPLAAEVEPSNPETAILLQQVLLAAGFEDIVGEASGTAGWSATGTWAGERYDVTLVTARPTGPPFDGCVTAMFRFDSDLPAEAKQAVHSAAACDGPSEDLSLTVVYEECVRAAGLTPFEAQVFVNLANDPLFLKTAPEVPAEIHNPCWESIGGEATGLSSYSRP